MPWHMGTYPMLISLEARLVKGIQVDCELNPENWMECKMQGPSSGWFAIVGFLFQPFDI